MERARPTEDEATRLRALHRLGVLDTPPEERFDRITRRAQDLLGAPIALVSLVDESRQWFKSCAGVGETETDRETSFCGHAIHHDDIFVVEDARVDDRFADNPFVLGEPSVRFYAGRPLHASTGERVGTLCVIDRRPRVLSSDERALLDDLGAWAEAELRVGEMQRVASGFAELERLRERVTQTVSHEMRGPLTNLLTSVDLVRRGEEGPVTTDQAELLDLATRNGQRLLSLVDDLLLLAALDAQDVEPAGDLVHLVAVVQEVAGECRRTTGATIDVRGSRELFVVGSRERLRQAILNLVGNAVKYGAAGGRVAIDVCASEGEALVAVRDRGAGISADDLPRIGERFFRTSSAAATRGTGLGVAITRAIAEQHRGRLEIRSRIGDGSTFTLVLPSADPAHALGHGEPAEPAEPQHAPC